MLLVVEENLLFIVFLTIHGELVLTVVGDRNLVHHRFSGEQVGTFAHLIALVEQLKTDSIKTDSPCHLFTVVVGELHPARPHLSEHDFGLLGGLCNDREPALLEKFFDLLLRTILSIQDVVKEWTTL